jgi:hypothetical protein
VSSDLRVKCVTLGVHEGGHRTCRSLNAILTGLKNCPFPVNTTIELKNRPNTSDNTGTLVGQKYPTGCQYVFDTFLSSISVLTPNGQFLDCAIIAFIESDVMSGNRRAFGAVLLIT